MPKEKKTLKLRDQKPIKDPQGGRRHGGGNKHLNEAGTSDARGNRRRHGGGRHF